MATFNLSSIAFESKTENNLLNEEIEQISFGEVSEYKIKLKFKDEVSPSPYTLSWKVPQIDFFAFWSPKTCFDQALIPDWAMRKCDSKTASGMPVACIYNKKNQNRFLIALSDPAIPSLIEAGVVEEDGTILVKTMLFSQHCQKMSEYEVTLRIDRRCIPFYNAVTDTRDWWSSLGFNSAYIPESAKDPLYSAWYSFHQRTIPDEIVYECSIAKDFGIKTLIVDDGWQTADGSRGYAYCGDWEICSDKIPDMKDFVDRIHALGMKFMIWFSVPFVGFYSKNYERFKGKYLYARNNVKASVLDPRFKEVRDFLVEIYADYVTKYGWDGLKLDFIDSFSLTDESSTDFESMDTVSLEEGVERLISEISARLKSINPDFLIEFRQSYVGPIMGRYGNMFRVTDCPNDALTQRKFALDLRLTSDKIPVHSDMLMWNKDETNEAVMYQLLATLFCVPQISIRFDSITNEHKALLKNYLNFWCEHRDTILSGKLEAHGAQANYTMAISTNNRESVAALYENVVISPKENVNYIFNSTGNDYIYADLKAEALCQCFDLFGNEASSLKLDKGAHRLNVPNCGMVKITY